jgi:hypothetical protein
MLRLMLTSLQKLHAPSKITNVDTTAKASAIERIPSRCELWMQG